jgi:hypothetical protein
LEAAVATSQFTTCIVNNDDMIPRTSISNLVSLIRFLAIVDKRLGEKGLRPTGPVGAVQLLKKVLVGSLSSSIKKKDNEEQDEMPTAEDNSDDDDDDGEEDTIMTGQEIFDGLNEARAGRGKNTTTNYRQQVMDDMDHLFVPGKVVVLYEKHVIDNEDSTAIVKPTPKTSPAAQVLNKGLEKGKQFTKGLANDLNTIISDMLYKKKEEDDKEAEKEEPEVISAGAIVADGAAPVLRHINLNRRMISDHMPDAYEKTLRALLQRKD